MPYTPLKTWADGDVILSADVQAELDYVRDYVRQMPATDIEASAWANSKHVMRGNYDPVQNVADLVSGQFGGQGVLFGTDFSYITAYNTLRVGSTVWEHVPLTSLTLEIRRPVTLFFQWWAQFAGYPDGSGSTGYGDLALFRSNKSLRNTDCRCRAPEEDRTVLTYRENRHVGSGFFIEDQGVGTYSLGLVGQATCSKVQLYSFGVSLEAFAL